MSAVQGLTPRKGDGANAVIAPRPSSQQFRAHNEQLTTHEVERLVEHAGSRSGVVGFYSVAVTTSDMLAW